MKLRLRTNSLRLRLLRSEVRRLAAGERLDEVITFAPDVRLVCTLEIADVEDVCATLDGNVIGVVLPTPLGREWANTDRMTIEHQQTIPSGQALRIVVEKDLVCLDRPGDPDAADAYPHPAKPCG